VDQKLTIGGFLLGCLIITATMLAYNRIEKLEDLVRKQQETIDMQTKAINLRNFENQMLRNMLGPRN
jgi:hypothetical protein